MDADGAGACAAVIIATAPPDRPQRFARLGEAAAIAALFRADLQCRRLVVVISDREDDAPAGFILLDRATGELEYCIAAPLWRRGYASEAFAALLPLLADRADGGQLFARTARENIASRALLEKHGFRFAGLDRVAGIGNLARFTGPDGS